LRAIMFIRIAEMQDEKVKKARVPCS